MGCSMDSLVFVSSWRNPIAQAKLQVKVALQAHIALQIMHADSRSTAEYRRYKQTRLWLSDNWKIME